MADNGAIITQRMADGDSSSWIEFMKANGSFMRTVIQRTIAQYDGSHCGTDVDDAFQDVMVRLVANQGRLLRSYDPDRASLRTWLAVIARSTALDALRKRPRGMVAVDDSVIEQIADEPRQTGLERLFPHPALSSRQNAVMELLFDHDLDVKEIARLLEIGCQTVRSLKHQAITKLRGLAAATA